MKKSRTLKKAINILCLQKNITQQDIADTLNITKSKLIYAMNNEHSKHHLDICEYVYDNLEMTVTPKISCILNDISYKEYCNSRNLNYNLFSLGGYIQNG